MRSVRPRFDNIFYGLTLRYFEDQALKTSRAKRGYSRDQRTVCKQVDVVLSVERDSVPQVLKVLNRNVLEFLKLPAVLEQLAGSVFSSQCKEMVDLERCMRLDENF